MGVLTEHDRLALRQLDAEIWERSRDRYGMKHSFEKRMLSDEEQSRVLKLIETSELPCVMHSGCYGGLSITVHDNEATAAVLMGEPSETLLCLGERHIFGRGHERTFPNWDVRFDFFSAITHSERNRNLCKFFNLPQPEARGHYSY